MYLAQLKCALDPPLNKNIYPFKYRDVISIFGENEVTLSSKTGPFSSVLVLAVE